MIETIIVTGGAGYVGSHTIIELLLNTQYNVVSIDNFSNSNHTVFERIEAITQKKVKNYNIDLCNKQLTEKVFEEFINPIGIIHFAAFKAVGESVANPLNYYHNNINSLISILEMAKKFNISNFIFSSSSAVYGNINTLPVSENTSLAQAESPYAHTKQIGEDIITNFINNHRNIKSILLRYFNPVGAHLSGLIGEDSKDKPNNLVPIITKVAIGDLPPLTVYGNDYDTRDGTCIRDYIHVSDVATAHINAFEYCKNSMKDKNVDVFNLGTGHGVSVLEVIIAFEKVYQNKLSYYIGDRRKGDVVSVYANNDKAKKLLNWQPKLTVDDMMSSAWKWEQNLKLHNNKYELLKKSN